MVGTMGTMNTDIDLQNDPDIPEARQMIIDLVGAHMGPTPKELPQFTNVAFHPILSGDDTDNLRLLIHAVYQAQSLIVSLPTGMTTWVMAGDEHGVFPDKDQILEDREGFELMPHPLSGELFQVRPEEALDLFLIEICPTDQPSERNQFSFFYFK